MPWKTLMYKTLGTFVDDLFAFCIKMPTLHRLACLRDDVVFFVYLYQKWKYPGMFDILDKIILKSLRYSNYIFAEFFYFLKLIIREQTNMDKLRGKLRKLRKLK